MRGRGKWKWKGKGKWEDMASIDVRTFNVFAVEIFFLQDKIVTSHLQPLSQLGST